MTFVVKDWRDDPDHTTPISAAALEDMESRLSSYSDTFEPAFSTFKPFTAPVVKRHNATAAGKYYYALAQGWNAATDGEADYGVAFGGGSNLVDFRSGIQLTKANLNAGSRTLKLQLKVTYVVNAVAPTSTFTWAFTSAGTASYGTSGNASTLIVGADAAGSGLALAAPSASSGPTVITKEF